MIKHADKKIFLRAYIRYLKIVDFILTNLPSPIGFPIDDTISSINYKNKPAIVAVNFVSRIILSIVMKTTLAGCAFTFGKNLDTDQIYLGLFTEPVQIENGQMFFPPKAGLGLEIPENVIQKYRIE